MRIRKRRPPTDFELLRAIWDRYHADFKSGHGRGGSQTSVFMPIDVPAVAEALGVSADSVVGRLYHHLDPLYAPANTPGKPEKHLFSLVVGGAPNCVNFPMLEAVFAGLWQERDRARVAITTAVVALGISIGSLIVAILALS